MFKVNSKNTKTKPIDAVAVPFGVNLTAKIFKDLQKAKLK